jgi:hypothetical protein
MAHLDRNNFREWIVTHPKPPKSYVIFNSSSNGLNLSGLRSVEPQISQKNRVTFQDRTEFPRIVRPSLSARWTAVPKLESRHK